jgi:hypothetical protein
MPSYRGQGLFLILHMRATCRAHHVVVMRLLCSVKLPSFKFQPAATSRSTHSAATPLCCPALSLLAPVAYRGGFGGSNPPKFRNFDKVPKIKKILLYEMKFLVPNYSCIQNPLTRGPLPPDPHSLCPQLNLLNPPNKIPGYTTG